MLIQDSADKLNVQVGTCNGVMTEKVITLLQIFHLLVSHCPPDPDNFLLLWVILLASEFISKHGCETKLVTAKEILKRK